MHEKLSRGPLSTTLPEFVAFLREALAGGKELVFLKRINRGGGARLAYHVTSASEAELILNRARPGDSISVFFPSAFPLRGVADASFARAAREWLDSQADLKDAAALVAVGGGAKGAEFDYVANSEELCAWLDGHPGATVLLGTMAFWKSNGDQVLTAYVPDPDGVVRPGAY